MAKLGFTKMHGCGNDYIYVIADRVRPADPAALSRRLSDRRFGIGGDGLIILAPSKSADVRMEMYNADGSRGEMCGNGIRCVARLHYERASRPRNPQNPQNPIVVETDCGLKSVAKVPGVNKSCNASRPRSASIRCQKFQYQTGAALNRPSPIDNR